MTSDSEFNLEDAVNRAAASADLEPLMQAARNTAAVAIAYWEVVQGVLPDGMARRLTIDFMAALSRSIGTPRQ